MGGQSFAPIAVDIRIGQATRQAAVQIGLQQAEQGGRLFRLQPPRIEHDAKGPRIADRLAVVGDHQDGDGPHQGQNVRLQPGVLDQVELSLDRADGLVGRLATRGPGRVHLPALIGEHRPRPSQAEKRRPQYGLAVRRCAQGGAGKDKRCDGVAAVQGARLSFWPVPGRPGRDTMTRSAAHFEGNPLLDRRGACG